MDSIEEFKNKKMLLLRNRENAIQRLEKQKKSMRK